MQCYGGYADYWKALEHEKVQTATVIAGCLGPGVHSVTIARVELAPDFFDLVMQSSSGQHVQRVLKSDLDHVACITQACRVFDVDNPQALVGCKLTVTLDERLEACEYDC
jgi:hypothetical protein